MLDVGEDFHYCFIEHFIVFSFILKLNTITAWNHKWLDLSNLLYLKIDLKSLLATTKTVIHTDLNFLISVDTNKAEEKKNSPG